MAQCGPRQGWGKWPVAIQIRLASPATRNYRTRPRWSLSTNCSNSRGVRSCWKRTRTQQLSQKPCSRRTSQSWTPSMMITNVARTRSPDPACSQVWLNKRWLRRIRGILGASELTHTIATLKMMSRKKKSVLIREAKQTPASSLALNCHKIFVSVAVPSSHNPLTKLSRSAWSRWSWTSCQQWTSTCSMARP